MPDNSTHTHRSRRQSMHEVGQDVCAAVDLHTEGDTNWLAACRQHGKLLPLLPTRHVLALYLHMCPAETRRQLGPLSLAPHLLSPP